MKKRILAIILLAATLLLQTPLSALAANTVFMVPEISADWEPPGMVWKSPALDALAYRGSGGFVADIINKRGLAAAVSDLNANVSAGDYSLSILGIYPEGEALTDEIMQMIAAEGWTRIEVYYPTFLLTGSPKCAGMTPVIEKTEDTALTQLLTTAGYTNQVATFKVDGVTMSDPWVILHEPAFSFLRGGTCMGYKYIPDIQKFVPGLTAIYDGYDRGFMDMENLAAADGDPNGTFVVATQPLPADLVITAAEIQPLRDQLKQEETQKPEDTQAPDDSQDQAQDSDTQTPDNEIIVMDKKEEIKWTFAGGTTPDNFTPEATVEVKSNNEVKVDFAYSGKLPEGTKVTIQLPKEATEYQDGTKLYFYYYNADTKEYEYVSESSAQGGEVTFDIKHCSEYLITSEKLVDVDIVEKGPDMLPILAVGLVLLVGVGVGAYVVINKKKK